MATLLVLRVVSVMGGGAAACTLLEVVVWKTGSNEISVCMVLDQVRGVFSTTVLLISLRVLVFSKRYIAGSSRFNMFHLIILRFVGSMLVLILSPRLISMILGWDGLGVTSFFLVVFYRSNKATNAGLITAISNRVGDGLLLVSSISLISIRTFRLAGRTLAPIGPPSAVLAVLAFAAFTKSAQIPFRA